MFSFTSGIYKDYLTNQVMLHLLNSEENNSENDLQSYLFILKIFIYGLCAFGFDANKKVIIYQ